MIDLLALIVITSLALYGSKVTWQEGMIFEKPKLWLDGLFLYRVINLDESYPYPDYKKTRTFWRYLSKPLYACPACMPSIWGSITYSINMCDTWNIGEMVLFDFATCGLTWVLMWQFPFDD